MNKVLPSTTPFAKRPPGIGAFYILTYSATGQPYGVACFEIVEGAVLGLTGIQGCAMFGFTVTHLPTGLRIGCAYTSNHRIQGICRALNRSVDLDTECKEEMVRRLKVDWQRGCKGQPYVRMAKDLILASLQNQPLIIPTEVAS